MIEQQIQEFNTLYPSYALGCLSREDLDKMLFFMEQSAELDTTVLAEYQRLSSLLTIVIEPKEPPPRLKKKIAKRLYELTRSEETTKNQEPETTVAKPQAENKKSVTEIVEDTSKSLDLADDDFINATLNKLNKKGGEQLIQPKESLEAVEEEEQSSMQSQADIDKLFGEDSIKIPSQSNIDKSEFIVDYNDPVDLDSIPIDSNTQMEQQQIPITYPEERLRKKTASSQTPENKNVIYGAGGINKIRWIDFAFAGILAVILIGVFLTYHSIKSDVGVISNKINSLSENNTNDFKKALTDVQHYLYNRKVLDNVIKSRDMMYIPLFGNPRNPNGYGRFLFDQNIRVGILFLSELPKIETDKVYRFWLSDGDTLLATDMKQSEMGKQFYEVVDLPVINNKKSISIFVTEEVLGADSRSISSKVYYSGKIDF